MCKNKPLKTKIKSNSLRLTNITQSINTRLFGLNRFQSTILLVALTVFFQKQICFGQQVISYNKTRSKDLLVLNENQLPPDSPRILTKYVYITSYEHHTVTLPCEILNLPNDMHVIWQYGKRGEINQTVLTVGGTQLETNYRVRVITNATETDRYSFDSSQLSSNREDSKENLRITTHNLEIRKLQSSDSGWYECQLPTKPTQINYVYLEVLALPRIDVSSKHPRIGESFEILCQVRNLPKRYEIVWIFNDKRLNINPINRIEEPINTENTFNPILNNTKYKKLNKIHKAHNYLTRRNVQENSLENRNFIHHKKRLDHTETYTVINDRIQNLTISRLRIKELSDNHKGIYKCRYDKIEAKYHLDIKHHLKTKIQLYDHDQLYSTSSHFRATNSDFKAIAGFFMILIILINKNLI